MLVFDFSRREINDAAGRQVGSMQGVRRSDQRRRWTDRWFPPTDIGYFDDQNVPVLLIRLESREVLLPNGTHVGEISRHDRISVRGVNQGQVIQQKGQWGYIPEFHVLGPAGLLAVITGAKHTTRWRLEFRAAAGPFRYICAGAVDLMRWDWESAKE